MRLSVTTPAGTSDKVKAMIASALSGRSVAPDVVECGQTNDVTAEVDLSEFDRADAKNIIARVGESIHVGFGRERGVVISVIGSETKWERGPYTGFAG